jgi:hypothetical protein
MRIATCSMVLLTALAGVGCASPDAASLRVDGWTLSGLPSLPDGRYQLWAEGDDGPTPVGSSVDGVVGSLTDPEALASATDAFVTIERDAVDEPAGPKVLQGRVDEAGFELSFTIDVSEIRGGVSLWTPTDENPDNHNQGAWFLTRVDDQNADSLRLPELPDGWSFSGWVGNQGLGLPMGAFRAAAGQDSQCAFCGDVVATFSHPGEDFVANLPDGVADVDLADGDSVVVLSLSPDVYDLSPDVYDLSPDVYDLSPDVYDFTGGGPNRVAIDVLAVDVPAGIDGGVLMDMEAVFRAPSAAVSFE